MAKIPSKEETIKRAREMYHRAGEVEIDEDECVSRAVDNREKGAYVKAWVWVPDAVRAEKHGYATYVDYKKQSVQQAWDFLKTKFPSLKSVTFTADDGDGGTLRVELVFETREMILLREFRTRK